MKQLYVYVQNPTAFKLWASATECTIKPIYNLQDAAHSYLANAEDARLYLIHLQEDEVNSLALLLEKGANVLLFSDNPTAEEGLVWFQKGIKGYLNTFAQADRIHQAIETVGANSVWLGYNVMAALIQNIPLQPQINNAWQENLTTKEIDTAEAVLEGLSNAQIAEKLFISERTVKARIHSLFEKFNVKDRLALVLLIQKLQRFW